MTPKLVSMFSGSSLEKQAAQDLAEAEFFGVVRLGQRNLFLCSLLRIRCVALNELAWVYLRCEDATASVCCGRAAFPSYYLMLVSHSGAVKKIPMESDKQIRRLLTLLEQRCPAVEIGYSRERAEKWGVEATPAS